MQNRYLSEIIQIDEENDIQHHGVLGMHWGIRRYQPYSLIPRKSGKRGKETGTAKKKTKQVNTSNSSQKKSRNQKSAEAKMEIENKAKTARQRKEELEKVVNSGDAKLVYEHRNELTKKQLDTAIERINTEAKLQNLVSYQNPGKIKKMKDFASKVEDVNSIVRTGVNTYNTAKSVSDIITNKKNKASKLALAEASAKTLKDIIDNGANASEIIKRQSELSDSDLKKAVSRAKTLEDDLNILRRDNTYANKVKERNNKYLEDNKRNLGEAIDKYGEDYARKKYNSNYDNLMIDSILNDRKQSRLDEQAANRHKSQTLYKENQAKKRRLGKG